MNLINSIKQGIKITQKSHIWHENVKILIFYAVL